MDARIRIFRHKTRFFWMALLIAAVVSLLAFLLLNWSFNDANGAFDRQDMLYSVRPNVSARDVDRLDIQADGVQVEVGMVNNSNRLSVELYGEDVGEARPRIDVSGSRVVIQYVPEEEAHDHEHKHENAAIKKATMRVLIPQNSLRTVDIKGSAMALWINHLRVDQLTIASKVGDLRLEDINANRVVVEGASGQLRAEDNYVTQFIMQTSDGEIILRNNDVQLMSAESKGGNVFLYAPTWRGQIIAQTEKGNITAVSRRLPWSLMIDAKAAGAGDVVMNYQTRFWEKPQVIAAEKNEWTGSVGNNPANALTLSTKDGHITIDKRSRYTDTMALSE